MVNVDDLLSELDCLGLDSTILEMFGSEPDRASATLRDKRAIAVDSWLARALEKQGYSPIRHSIRRNPDAALAYTSAAWNDYTDRLSDKTEDDLDLASVFVTPGSDFLYIGYSEPMRGVWVAMLDAVNGTSLSVCDPRYWNGRWAAFNSLVDETQVVPSISFSGAGRIGWQMPTDWQTRSLHQEPQWRYWLRLGMSGNSLAPSSLTSIGQLLPLRKSRFTDPAAMYALSLLYGESWGSQRGSWKEKSESFLDRASQGLSEVLSMPTISDEFRMADEESIAADDIGSTAPEQASDLFTWQRG